MISNFSFDSNIYDLWPIYNGIKKFYPIGIDKGEGVGTYFEYQGIKNLENIVIENIHTAKNYKERWVNFTNRIGQELGCEMVGTTYGQAPSFSSSVIIQANDYKTSTHTKELHFSISLIGDFYQIYGLDKTRILDNENNKMFPIANVITISPYAEYREVFDLVENKIKDKNPEHRIIPFSIGQEIINGLQVRYLDDTNCSINKALFNHFLSKEYISGHTRGNEFYGLDKWKKPDR